MKQIVVFLLTLFLLCGCSSAGEVSPAAETTPVNPRMEEQLLDVFQQNAREGSQVMDCEIMEHSDYGIAGVVQYTLTDDNLCRFDLIRNDGTLNRIGMEFLTDGEETLAIAGPDSFSFRAIEADGSVYTLTISYYEDAQTGEKGFRVSQSK